MNKIADQRELFAHELASMLYVERELVDKVLPGLIDEISNDELKHGIEEHLEETRMHVANLERVFELLGEEPETEQSPAFEGLKKQHGLLAKKVEDEHLADVVHAGAAAQAEHLEIAAYNRMISLAEAAGEEEIVALLEENLDQEHDALREVELATERLSREAARA